MSSDRDRDHRGTDIFPDGVIKDCNLQELKWKGRVWTDEAVVVKMIAENEPIKGR
jgi:hypothetical protein